MRSTVAVIIAFRFRASKQLWYSYIEHETAAGNTIHLPDLAASFEAAVFDVQYKKAKGALHETGLPVSTASAVASRPIRTCAV